MDVKKRIEQLRQLMQDNDLAAVVVPSADPHMSEYVAQAWQRRAFITGFDGSAGTAVITLEKAGLWTDGRYWLQAEDQLAGTGVDLFKQGDTDVPEPEVWLEEVLPTGARVGLNPRVFSAGQYAAFSTSLATRGLEAVSLDEDLVDQVWGAERPALPAAPVKLHPVSYAGMSVHEKLVKIREALKASDADVLIVAALDEVAWVLNLRGADVPYNPVFVAYLAVTTDQAFLFIHPKKLPAGKVPSGVQARPYDEIEEWLGDMGEKVVWLDPATVNAALEGCLGAGGARVLKRPSPIPAWKAAKNTAEMAGMEAAHRRDGVAMVRFLRWLDEAVPLLGVTELSVAQKLLELRSESERFVGPSFNTIAGYQGHGAIVHYAASEESNAGLRPEGILLVDSGGQYLDGTTDITRTLTLGEPTEQQRWAYTAVLKGHLRLGRAIFPPGTDGYQLDVLARSELWNLGLNYGHGTGHGVGAYLCVHEGPFSVSLRRNLTPLEPGNILSNEPGYYEPGEFGIRIENLVRVVEKREGFLGFEELTLCPYDRRLIDRGMLTPEEIAQVDDYHARIRHAIHCELEDFEDRRWLETATAPLA